MGNISTQNAFIIDFVFLTVSLIFLLLRLYVRLRILRDFNTIDGLIILSWLCFFFFVLIDVISERMGFWDPRLHFDGTNLPDYEAAIPDKKTLKNLLVMVYALSPINHICVYSIKLVFCLLYCKLFPPSMVKLRRANYATAVIVMASLLWIIGSLYFWCLPVQRNWTLNPAERCLSWSTRIPYIIAALCTIITDILVYALPFFLLPTLYRNSNRGRITGIIVLFSLGTLSLATTTGRIISATFSPTAQLISAWNAAEMCTAVVVACCPPLKWFFGAMVAESRRNKITGCVCRCNQRTQRGRGRATTGTSVAHWDDGTDVEATYASSNTDNGLHGLAAPGGAKGQNVGEKDLGGSQSTDSKSSGDLDREAFCAHDDDTAMQPVVVEAPPRRSSTWKLWRNSRRFQSTIMMTTQESRQEPACQCACQEETPRGEGMGNVTFGR